LCWNISFHKNIKQTKCKGRIGGGGGGGGCVNYE
jgi:hypothetical protein